MSDQPTINELLDELPDGREREAARRRVYAARQEIREAVDALTELLEERPDDPEEWTIDDLDAVLRSMQLQGNCLEAQRVDTAVALDDLRAIKRESE